MGTTLPTDTVDSSVVQVVTEGAFTAERAVRVDADAVLADAGVVQTLVHIYTQTRESKGDTMVALPNVSRRVRPCILGLSVVDGGSRRSHLLERLPAQAELRGRRDTDCRRQLEGNNSNRL